MVIILLIILISCLMMSEHIIGEDKTTEHSPVKIIYILEQHSTTTSYILINYNAYESIYIDETTFNHT